LEDYLNIRKAVIAILILVSLCWTSLAQDKDETEAQMLCQYWFDLGLHNMENPEPFFEKAIEVCPDCALPYYWLARYYGNSEKETEAVDMFKTYLKVVDRDDPQETARIEAAEDYIKGVRLEE